MSHLPQPLDRVARVAPTAAADARQPMFWRERLAAYAQPSIARAIGDLITSVVPYFAVCVAMYPLIAVSPWLALALSPLSAAFLVRTFVVFHDCTHGSFLPSRRANLWVGALTGIIVLTPFVRWRHDHAIHHATAGDLDKRGVGDLPTLTVEEYWGRSPRERLAYRALRHPLVMFTIGPVIAMIVGPRLVARDAPARMRRSVLATDVALALIFAGVIWAIGVWDLLLIWGPAALLSGAAGVWLFYVQHQFEDVQWQRSEQWHYADAALTGSSFLKLPRVLQFFSGNIGYHHIHHLSVRIPNYNLQRTHEENPVFQSVPVLTMMDGLRATRLKLWDEHEGSLVTFRQAAGSRPPVSRRQPARS